MTTKRHIIAKNIATLLHDGDFVNLGIGIPTLIGNYLPEGVTILLHGENGYVGQGKELPDRSMYDSKEA
ncbi:MAG: succinyl-CoA--3-ketoacid-CoA transferase, partial [Firmicutes bacterium]|nr:succinyl-CoA--3-ketoacid-CoA transferase [Bacillota bacterium]